MYRNSTISGIPREHGKGLRPSLKNELVSVLKNHHKLHNKIHTHKETQALMNIHHSP